MRVLRTATALVLLAVLIGCAPTSPRKPDQGSVAPEHASEPAGRFGGPQPGELAPPFSLPTLNGRHVSLGELLQDKPVALITGSYSCPMFRFRSNAVEKLHRKYGDRVHVFILYTVEAHPVGSHSPYKPREWVTIFNRLPGILVPQPQTLPARREQARTAADRLDLRTPILLDDMNNSTWRAYGSAPNAAYLIDHDSRVAVRHAWFHPETFERSIQPSLN